MTWSVRLFSVRGIAVRVHASFLLVLLWAGYTGLTMGGGTTGQGVLHGVAFMVLFVLLLFACVVLHELGHSLVAQLFGVKVQDITLWPIGGVARMARMPDKPYQEFVISAAGPATNIFLATVFAAAILAIAGPQQVIAQLASPWRLGRVVGRLDIQALLFLLVINNVALALFNLVPAFPMDGGRLFRSLLASVLPFGAATRIASWLGQAVAALMIAVALATSNIFLTFVGVLVFLAAWQERDHVATAEHLRGMTVSQVMQPLGQRLHPLQRLGEVATFAVTAPQPAYAVVDAGRLVGWLGRGDLLLALRKAGPEARVMQHMRRDVLRIAPDEGLVAVRDRLAERRTPTAFVIAEGRVSGMLSSGDLARLSELLEVYPGALGKTSRDPDTAGMPVELEGRQEADGGTAQR